MSELTSYYYYEDRVITPATHQYRVYHADDADKVIAEKDAEIQRLENLCESYRIDCDNLAISKEQAKRAARTLLKKMNHHKYKRCLAMAKWCASERDIYNLTPRFAKMKFYTKWRQRWLELAEQFKEVTNAVDKSNA